MSKLEKHANALVFELRHADMAHSEQKASGDRMTLASRRLKVPSIRTSLGGRERSTHELFELLVRNQVDAEMKIVSRSESPDILQKENSSANTLHPQNTTSDDGPQKVTCASFEPAGNRCDAA